MAAFESRGTYGRPKEADMDSSRAVATAVMALARLRHEVEYRLGKEDREFCKYVMAQLRLIESAVQRVKGGNRNQGSIQ